MLEIRGVRFQNFFSFGNQLHELSFEYPRPTLAIGKNGHGKSSACLDAIVYGLYGKPYKKIKLGQAINSITERELLVEVDFRTRGSEWTVRRGMKPSVFEVWRDGTLLDQAASTRDQQEWLEKSVLMMDVKTFCQVVILGSANHVPFMQLPAAQRREVVEDVLDIQVFSRMNEVLKERARGVKETLQERERELAVVRRELEVEERHVESMKRNVDEERRALERDLAESKKRRGELEAEAEELSARAQELTERTSGYEELRRTLSELTRVEGSLQSKRSRLERELEFYRHAESCPTCKQSIRDDFRQQELVRLGDDLKKLSEGEALLREKTEDVSSRIGEIERLQREIQSIDQDFVRKKSDARALLSRESSREEELASLVQEADADESLLRDLRERVAELGRLRDETTSEAKTMAHASLLLKDQGIKARIIKQYVPVMNRLVNKYLSAMEMFVDFQLDETFAETIRSRHRDTFSYESFSEGEKLRLDLAILFAWRDIARSRNSSAVDLVIFDEVLDRSLDSEGADYFMKMVQDLVDGTHVVIVSHREGLEDKFSRVLKFEKKSNFSRVEEQVSG